MLSITHAATGAFIATKIPNPIISIPLILASHYLEDYILHWDVGTGLSSGKKKPSQAIKQELVDMLLTGIFIFLFFQTSTTQINFFAWGGAFVALLPDFLEAPRNFLHWEPKLLSPLNQFHHYFHRSTPDMIRGLAPQAVVLILVAFFAS